MHDLTLRRLLEQALTWEVPLLNDALKACDPDNPVDGYHRVIDELLALPAAAPYKHGFRVVPEHTREEPSRLHVCLFNPKAVDWPKNKRPWGGADAPDGYFNVNDPCYVRYYSLIGLEWSVLIDTPVEIVGEISLPNVVADMLWNMTFDGWSQKQRNDTWAEQKKSMDQAYADLVAGDCVTFDKAGVTVVVPNTVVAQLGAIIDKK